MSKRGVVKKKRTAPPKTALQKAVWDALSFTGRLVARLKKVQIEYIKVGQALAKARDEKMYGILKHPSLEDYAEKRLGLSRSSLYRYLMIHDWVKANKPEWLLPKPKGRIPDLADIAEAIKIEDVLKEHPRMSQSKRNNLEELKQMALDNRLSRRETAKAVRTGSKSTALLKLFESRLRALRRDGTRITGVPSEVIGHLDSAIGLLKNEHAAMQAGLNKLAVPLTLSGNAYV